MLLRVFVCIKPICILHKNCMSKVTQVITTNSVLSICIYAVFYIQYLIALLLRI